MYFSKFKFFSVLLVSGLLISCGGSGVSTDDTTDTSTDVSTDDSDTDTTSVSQVYINEVVAAASDDGNDWFEIYVASGTVNLADYSVVDDKEDREPQALPDVTLSEGEFIVVQAIDEEDVANVSGNYVTFKLGSDDALTLFHSGVTVDVLDWQDGDAPEGYSFGRYADGEDNTQTLTPTPGSANTLSDSDGSDSEATPEPTPTADSGITIGSDTTINENAELRINEVVAKDSAAGYDWIELYVSGDTSVNLASYYVADESGAASYLPDVTLNAGDFYRVYATGEAIAELETVNFKLGSSDTVSLYLGDDLIDQLSWKKGQALMGYSYGRLTDGSDATTTLTPSPMSANVAAIRGPLVISEVVANAVDDGADWFELTNVSDAAIALGDYQIIDSSDDIDAASLPDMMLAAGDAVVIYAVDEDPGDNYVPFKLGNDDELSLILNDEVVDYLDWDASDVPEGYSYGLTDTSTWDKNTLVPTPGTVNESASAFDSDVVADLYLTVSDENWLDILNNPLDEEYHEAAISLNDVSLDSVAIRTKGGSSLRSVASSTSDRFSFKIDINEYVDGQKFYGLKKFTLQNSFNDPTYMREVIAYDLLDELGVPTPKHSFVNFYVNGQLFGLYLMVEAVDGEFVEDHFSNSNGDLYKPDGIGSDLQWLSESIASYTDLNLQNNEETTDNGAFINLVSDLDVGSSDLVDVDNLLRYMAVSVSLSNMDSYHGPLAHNYYFYEQDGVFTLLPWDFNESFGTFNMNCDGVDIRELTIDEPTNSALSERPLVANVFSNPEYLAIYHDYLWQLINGPLSSAAFATRIESIASLIRSHVENDPSAFYGVDAFDQNLTTTYDRFYGLTEFMDYRVDNMISQLNGDIASAGDGSGFCGADVMSRPLL